MRRLRAPGGVLARTLRLREPLGPQDAPPVGCSRPGGLSTTSERPLTMNQNIFHPCGKLYLLQSSLDAMSKEQLDLANSIHELAAHPGVSAACETLCVNAIVMAGISKRLQELRYQLNILLP